MGGGQTSAVSAVWECVDLQREAEMGGHVAPERMAQ